MTKSMRILSFCGGFALASSLSAAPWVTMHRPSTFDLPRETDPADRAEIIRLYDAAAIDRDLNIFTRRLDGDAVRQLQRGLEGGHPQVQISTLAILASAAAHGALPSGEPTQEISRAVAAVVAGSEASAAAETVRADARRVAWHLKLMSMRDPKDRAAFLAPLLNPTGSDGLYYAYESIDYLSELGAEGDRVLRAFVVEDTKRSIDSEIMGRARLGVRKIELSRQLERAGPGDAVRTLAAAARTPTKRQMDREFGKWVVGQLAKRRPEAESELRALVDDEQVTDDVRIVARFALSDEGKQIRWRW